MTQIISKQFFPSRPILSNLWRLWNIVNWEKHWNIKQREWAAYNHFKKEMGHKIIHKFLDLWTKRKIFSYNLEVCYLEMKRLKRPVNIWQSYKGLPSLVFALKKNAAFWYTLKGIFSTIRLLWKAHVLAPLQDNCMWYLLIVVNIRNI